VTDFSPALPIIAVTAATLLGFGMGSVKRLPDWLRGTILVLATLLVLYTDPVAFDGGVWALLGVVFGAWASKYLPCCDPHDRHKKQSLFGLLGILIVFIHRGFDGREIGAISTFATLGAVAIEQWRDGMDLAWLTRDLSRAATWGAALPIIFVTPLSAFALAHANVPAPLEAVVFGVVIGSNLFGGLRLLFTRHTHTHHRKYHLHPTKA
jgi:hypothetical protein